ncbi:MAG: LytTR family DNA-binding domain-containing protein [Gammaproteobacteria bacterium]|nr:LytTR family DNA-binding domain-containing protein [Gammaproteobacteria bacterium]
MRILIADDEAPARARLQRLVGEGGDCEVVGEAASGRETLAAVETLHPELILLDIRMPDGDGLSVAAALARSEPRPAVIFVTALDDQALGALEAGAAAYLVKPVVRERLAEAIARARRPTQAQLAALAAEGKPRTHLAARVGRDLRLIPVEEILYFRAVAKTTIAILRRGEVVVDRSLSTLEEEFDQRFVRIRRNLLVARGAIVRLHRDGGPAWIELAGGERLPVARRHLREVMAVLAGSGNATGR